MELVEQYMAGQSIASLARKFHMGHLTVRRLLESNGVAVRSPEEQKRLSRTRSVPMSHQLQERLVGELLGDGRIILGKHMSPFSFASKHIEYAQWMASLFSLEHIPLAKGGVKRIEQQDARTGRTYMRYAFLTKGTVELHAFGAAWYAAGKKSIPTTLVLSKLAVLHWWLGDGTIGRRCGFFCTDCFTSQEVERLSKDLNRLFDICSRPVRRRNPNGNEVFRIYLPRVSLVKMLNSIGMPPLKCLAHRWKIDGGLS